MKLYQNGRQPTKKGAQQWKKALKNKTKPPPKLLKNQALI